MSRSTIQRSRADGKAGKAASATPAIAHEIVPGKYNDQDWGNLVEHDDGEEFVFDIMEDLCTSVMDIIYSNYIQKQLVPYTVSQAKDAILQIIEWQFLDRDDGELNVDSDEGWIQDEEPEPAVTDCWAQGSVPKQIVRLKTPTIVEEDEEPAAQEENVDVADAEQAEESTGDACEEEQEEENDEDDGGSEPLEESDLEEEPEEPQVRQPEPEQVEPKPKPSKRKFKPYTGRLKSAGVAKMTESLDDTEMKIYDQENLASYQMQSPDLNQMQMPASCTSMLKLQAGRPPGHRDVLFDESGNIISVQRLDPDKLPTHKVKTGFRIIDPEVEAAQARLEAMRTGKYVSGDKVPRPPPTSKTGLTRHPGNASRTYSLATTNSKHNTNKESKPYDVVPLPPPLIETITLAPGVIIKEGNQVRKGPRKHGKKLDAVFAALQKELKPVQMRAMGPTLTVAELLEHQTPVVKPLVDNAPIPPIAQRQTVE